MVLNKYKYLIIQYILVKTQIVIKTTILLTILYQTVCSQNFKTDKLLVPSVTANFGVSLPMADLKRYSGFSQAGASFLIKFKNNAILSAEGVTLFTNKHKGESPLQSILNSNGTITDGDGNPAQFAIGVRGMQLQVRGGYICSKFAHNPNSGITVSAGVIFFQSKYWIDQRGNNAHQIMNDYVKGYDKLSSGFGLSQFIGYTYYHNKNFWNVYAGIEFSEAWTKDRRDWDFALMKKNDVSYFDAAATFKIGWIITFIHREADEVYYF